jgi:hypothetical protein
MYSVLKEFDKISNSIKIWFYQNQASRAPVLTVLGGSVFSFFEKLTVSTVLGGTVFRFFEKLTVSTVMLRGP